MGHWIGLTHHLSWRTFLVSVLLSWILLGAFSSALAYNPVDRTRKTGEYGQRIRPKIGSDSLERPSISSTARADQTMTFGQVSEANGAGKVRRSKSRKIDNTFGGASPEALEIRKPSLNLELPHNAGYNHNFVPDQDAEETNEDGYSYPAPKPGLRVTTEEPIQPTKLEPLNPQTPLVRAGNTGSILGLKSESETDIDSVNLRPLPESKPEVLGIESDLNNAASDCSGGQYNPSCSSNSYEGVIPGEAGKDYPVLSDIIQTDFSCDDYQYSGYYADVDPRVRCQIFHICLKRNRNRKTQQWSFLCPNGTVFSQEDFVCVWWADAPQCSDSGVRSLYSLNEKLGWDNIKTNGEGQRNFNTGVGELEGSMSAVSSSTAALQKKKTNSIPYRIPVKVHDGSTGKAKTKLVPQNVLQSEDSSYDYEEDNGDELNSFEAREAAASQSENVYSESHGADGVQPLIVNRQRPSLAPTERPNNETGDLFMISTRQRFPDGSEGYGEVPVMMRHHEEDSNPANSQDSMGYQYQRPKGTFTATTEYFAPPTIPTEPPIPANHEDYYQYKESTTEQPVDENSIYNQQPNSEDEGYQYPPPDLQNEAFSDVNGNAVTITTTDRNMNTPPNYNDEGYQYKAPTTQRSLRYQTETTTFDVATASTPAPYPDSGTESPGSESHSDNQFETTTAINEYRQTRPGVVTTESYDDSLSSTRVTDFDTTTERLNPSKQVEMPSGSYLPPQNKEESSNKEVDISDEEVDYEDDELGGNEGYGSVSGNTANGNGNNDRMNNQNVPTGTGNTGNIVNDALTESFLDSDEKLKEILEQVQNGGIEAVDGNGSPIEFSRLKELLLNSPKGSIELQGALDSVPSSSTQAPQASLREPTPVTRLSGLATAQERPYNYDSPRSISSTSNALSSNLTTPDHFLGNSVYLSQLPETNIRNNVIQSPSSFYLPPNTEPNGAINSEQQLLSSHAQNTNTHINSVTQPGYDIRLPSREFESHSVLSNFETDGNLLRENADSQLQHLTRLNTLAQLQNLQSIPDTKLRVPTNQFNSPSLSTVGAVVNEAPRYDYQKQEPVFSAPQGEYLPPRQATSSILQPQYYQIPPTNTQSASLPIQLTENIQLQQSIALPSSSSLASALKDSKVLPKDIKIFPAVFVHHHTSVTSQTGSDSRPGYKISSLNDSEDSFQNLETAQSTYYAPVSSSLAQQLHQISTRNSDRSSSKPRQFFRRSNNGSYSTPLSATSGRAKSPPTVDITHDVTSFTLEDARSAEELQKYHQEDLKRFHTENIAKQGGVLDNVSITRGSSSNKPRLSPVLAQQRQTQPRRNERTEGTNATRFSIGVRNVSRQIQPSVEREKVHSNKDVPNSQRNQDYFIPISGSYGGSGSSRIKETESITRPSEAISSDDINSKEFLSQFRVSGGSKDRNGAGPSGRRRSIDIVESERILLSSFLPETEGGFGSKLVIV